MIHKRCGKGRHCEEINLARKVQLTAGICAAKALVQHLCERFHDPDNVHIFIPGV